MKNSKKIMMSLLALVVSLFVAGCDLPQSSRAGSRDVLSSVSQTESTAVITTTSEPKTTTVTTTATTTSPTTTTTKLTTTTVTTTTTTAPPVEPFDLSLVPEYSGSAYIAINDNKPYFSKSDLTTDAYEKYSPLDSLGRCGTAISCIALELMPTEERGSIGMVKPSGWHTVKYDGIDGNYLYNRCHLIGYQLTGENANEQNLVTGTRYLNIEGMLPIENDVASYIKSTGNHVLYRSTPIFDGNDLLCRGVLLEGYSVEDSGKGICFCYFAYNVQPGITINYSNGESSGPEYVGTTVDHSKKTTVQKTEEPDVQEPSSDTRYVLNTNTKKFHLPDCSSVKDIKDKNRQDFDGTREEAIEMGYDPCKRCNP